MFGYGMSSVASHPGGRLVAIGKILTAGAAVDGHDVTRTGGRVVFKRVSADMLGYRNGSAAPGHDGAVAGHRVVAMHGGQKLRPDGGIHPFEGFPANPGRKTRVYVHDIRSFGFKPFGHPPNVLEGLEALLPDCPVQVFSASCTYTVPDGSVPGNNRDLVPPGGQELRQLSRHQLRPANIERNQRLDYMHVSFTPKTTASGSRPVVCRLKTVASLNEGKRNTLNHGPENGRGNDRNGQQEKYSDHVLH